MTAPPNRTAPKPSAATQTEDEPIDQVGNQNQAAKWLSKPADPGRRGRENGIAPGRARFWNPSFDGALHSSQVTAE